MEEVEILSQEEIEERLKEVSGWEFKDNKISKRLEFINFLDALLFINTIAPYFEKMDHHADMTINYNKVLFELTRWDVGGKVTNRDFTVAKEIDRLFSLRNFSI